MAARDAAVILTGEAWLPEESLREGSARLRGRHAPPVFSGSGPVANIGDAGSLAFPEDGTAAPGRRIGNGPEGFPVPASRREMPETLRATLRSARDLARERAERQPEDPLRTGVAALDRLLGGGLPRGRMVELVGRRSSGRFSLVLAALAGATITGEAAALVDLGDHLDPQAAAAAGVRLERLLWVRPSRLREALACTEMTLGSGFPLVVLDLGTPPVPGGAGLSTFWLRLARAAATHRGALLVASPYRVGGTAAAAVIVAERGEPRWHRGRGQPALLEGIASRLMPERSRLRQTGGCGTVDLAVAEATRPAAPSRATRHLTVPGATFTGHAERLKLGAQHETSPASQQA